MIKIAILNDDRCTNDKFEHIHGFSAWFDVDGYKFLFDAGQEDCFIKNAERLKIDLNQVQSIVLSHGDYDHGNGLKFLSLPDKVPLICHPDYQKYRKSKRTGNFDGLNQTAEQLSQKYDVQTHRECFEMAKNIFFLGQIERNSDFEIGNLPMTDRNGQDYPHLDDSAVAIKTDRGLVIVTGCAHSGICNIIEFAKKVCHEDRVYAAIGGFHLRRVDRQTEKTADYLQGQGIEKIFLAHCTSDDACKYLKERLSGITEVTVVETGSTITL